MAVREGTPAAIVERLHTELVKAVSQPDVINNLAADGSRPMPQSPEEFGTFLKNEVEKWLKVTRAAGIQAR